MENKQSSVEQLELDLIIWFTLSGIHFPIEIKNSIERVKAMHKEEIQTSHECGQQSEKDYNRNGDKIGCRFIEKSEQYYNETFGGKKQC